MGKATELRNLLMYGGDATRINQLIRDLERLEEKEHDTFYRLDVEDMKYEILEMAGDQTGYDVENYWTGDADNAMEDLLNDVGEALLDWMKDEFAIADHTEYIQIYLKEAVKGSDEYGRLVACMEQLLKG